MSSSDQVVGKSEPDALLGYKWLPVKAVTVDFGKSKPVSIELGPISLLKGGKEVDLQVKIENTSLYVSSASTGQSVEFKRIE